MILITILRVRYDYHFTDEKIDCLSGRVYIWTHTFRLMSKDPSSIYQMPTYSTFPPGQQFCPGKKCYRTDQSKKHFRGQHLGSSLQEHSETLLVARHNPTKHPALQARLNYLWPQFTKNLLSFHRLKKKNLMAIRGLQKNYICGQHQWSLGKCKLKLQWDTTSH